MTIKTHFTAGVLSAALTQAAGAQVNDTPDLEWEQTIASCMQDALDAVNIPNARPHYDQADGGLKKYHESETSLIGVTSYLNSYGENIGTIEDAVYFQAKFYHEDDELSLDSFREISLNFTEENGIHAINHGHAMSYTPDNFISDFDAPLPEIQPQEKDSLNWVNDAANTLALHFTICMNFEPYEVGGWANTIRPIQPPQWPEFIETQGGPSP
ncbi:MAG: hypothetical protein ACLFR0_03220 [Alphaproteobacteria bacterium]